MNSLRRTRPAWSPGLALCAVLCLGWPAGARAAEPELAAEVTLDELVRAARDFYPRGREQQLRAAVAERRLETLEARFRPQLEVAGQAAYHSSVPELPAALGVSPPQDQYVAYLDVEQLLWDGGRTAGESALEQASRDVDVAAVEVDFLAWRERVEDAYFLVLSTDAELELAGTLVEDLKAQLAVFDARVRAGVALAGDRAALAAELASLQQQIIESKARRCAALDLIAALTGQRLSMDVVLTLPDPEPPADLLAAAEAAASGAGVGRPEIAQARETQRLLQERWKLSGLADKPVVSAFAQGGVGRPADQDFFETDLTPYVVAGLRVRWRPFDWGSAAREQETRALEQEIAAARLETVLTSVSATLRQLARSISGWRELLATDDQIVELRAESSRQSAAQLREGTITATSYLLERNAEHRARLTRELHQLRLRRDSVSFMTTLGVSR